MVMALSHLLLKKDQGSSSSTMFVRVILLIKILHNNIGFILPFFAAAELGTNAC